MPVIFDTLTVQLLFYRVIYDLCPAKVIILIVHSRPLERGERLWNKEGSTDRDLTFSVSLILRDLIITNRDLIGEFRDRTHILRSLRRQSKHEIQFHLLPSAFKCHSRAMQNDILRQSLIDHVSKAL